MLENVPTAPLNLPTAIAVRAPRRPLEVAVRRQREERDFAPKVVGSACMPWVRPTTGEVNARHRTRGQRVTIRPCFAHHDVHGLGQIGAQRRVDNIR